MSEPTLPKKISDAIDRYRQSCLDAKDWPDNWMLGKRDEIRETLDSTIAAALGEQQALRKRAERLRQAVEEASRLGPVVVVFRGVELQPGDLDDNLTTG